MLACKARKRVCCIKIGNLNSAKSTNVINIDVQGPENSVKINMEADTGANITVLKGAMIEDLDWVNLEPTNVHIKGYDGVAKACLGKFELNFHNGTKLFKEMAYFSNSTTSNFLSRDACIALGIVPKGFPNEQVSTVKSSQDGIRGIIPPNVTEDRIRGIIPPNVT